MKYLFSFLAAIATLSCATAPAYAEVLCHNIEKVQIFSNQEEPPSLDEGLNEAGQAHLVWNDLDLLKDGYTVMCYTSVDDTDPVTKKTFRGVIPASCEQKDGELACH